MNLNTDYIIKNIKKEYLSYMDSLEISENDKKTLYWNEEDNHINIYVIQLTKTSNSYLPGNRYKSLIFATESQEDSFNALALPEGTEIPYLEQKTVNEIYKYLVKHKLIDIDVNINDPLFMITATIFEPDFDSSDNMIEAFKQWSYHFLNTQLSLIEDTLLNGYEDKDEYEDVPEVLMNKVNDEIFSYQYKEATELFSLGYYLGSACVFGVALERVCMLIAKKNKLKLHNDKTEIGYFAYELYNNKVISNSYKKRLLGSAKFRNISSHTNAKAIKSDPVVLDTIIRELVNEYL